jgi:phosphatidylserine/phosphatidylglycerophosphate/cardiolipin synthase-like enzyme
MRLAFLSLLLVSPAYAETTVSFQNQTANIVQLIDNAQHSIHLAAYSFTSKPIAAALVHAHQRGVDVEVVLDKSNQTAHYSAATFLANQNIPTRINCRYAIMHDKFMVIDGKTVETGSFNYTRAAEEKNAENVIILRDDPAVARQYDAEWQRLWNEALH